jgi:hypothetical protein
MDANANLSRAEAAPRVAQAFGIPVDNVHGEDWLGIMVSSKESDARRSSAMNVAERAIGAVVAAEQSAAFVGGKNRTNAVAAANAFLLALEGEAAGDPLSHLQDTTWLAKAVGADATGAQEVAATVAMVSRQVVAAKALGNKGDTVAVLTEWAKIAHVAEGWFAGNASMLKSGEITPQQYQCVPVLRSQDVSLISLMSCSLGYMGDTVVVLSEWEKIAHVAEGWFVGMASMLKSGEITPSSTSVCSPVLFKCVYGFHVSSAHRFVVTGSVSYR